MALRRFNRFALAAPLLLAPVFWGFQAQPPHRHPPAGEKVTDRIPDYHKSEAEARPFPATLDPAQFQHPAVQRAYRAAREIPGVLAQQPCYCYCDRIGHKGLLACHRDNHSAG